MTGLAAGGQKDLTAPPRWCLVPRDTEGLSCSVPFAIGLPCTGELDDQLLGLDLDARDVGADEAPVVDGLRGFDVVPDRCGDQRLDLCGGHAANRSRALDLA